MNNLETRAKLEAGEKVTRTVHGRSMTPRICSGDTVTVYPIPDLSVIDKGDVVFCKVGGNFYFHLVKAKKYLKNQGKWFFLIGNNHGGENGWTSQVFGLVLRETLHD